MKISKHIAVAVFLLICFFASTPSASALTISPVKVEVTGDPGQTLHGELELLNEQAQVKTFYSSFENFEPSGDTGSPKFIGGGDGLASWLGTQNSVTISTGETVKVPYTITIPASAEAGGYFSAIFWGEQDPTTQTAGEVAIGGKLGVLILLRVSGDIEEEGGVSDFTIVGDNKLQVATPIAFSYRFANSGGDRVVPLGDITISNMFGGQTATIPANLNEGSVLPNSGRKFQATWGEVSASSSSFFAIAKQQLNDLHFGAYKAELAVVYGATNQSAKESIWFIIFPWQLTLVCLILVVVAILVLKKYNAWIISKSKANT